MPDKAGAFLKASEIFACLKINITRVSYNKAVDTHTLFIEAEGTSEQLKSAAMRLEEIGYLSDAGFSSNVVLTEFKLDDKPGQLLKILELIEKYKMNISYISSHENGLGFQLFRMGLFVSDNAAFSRFLGQAEKICPVTQIEYSRSEVVLDNSIFYRTYVDELASDAGLKSELKAKLAVNVNRAMQILDEKNMSPRTAFDSIAKVAKQISSSKGTAFKPRITEHAITQNSSVTVIEPPCGSNTYILKSNGKFLFIDCGYASYRDEMKKIFDAITGDFSAIDKKIFVTHADVDHTGLLDMFDEILVSDKTKEFFLLQAQNKRDFREQNPVHLPYVRICKLLTHYAPPPVEKLKIACRVEDDAEEPVYKAGEYRFGEFEFEIYATAGGHLSGEIILINRKYKLVFSGDVYVNLHGFTPEQAVYNRYAPILMTSVDTDVELARLQRKTLLSILGEGTWRIFGGHGAMAECVQ